MAKSLKIRDLTLRDGQQSSFATRMNQAQIDRCLPFYKDANFYAMEVWGGAVPDSVMRYLNENPCHPLATNPLKLSRIWSALRPLNWLKTDSFRNSNAQPAITQ